MPGKLTNQQRDWIREVLGVDMAPDAPSISQNAAPASATFSAPWAPKPMGPFEPPPDTAAPAPSPSAPAPAPTPTPAPALAAPTVSIAEVPVIADTVVDFVKLANAALGGRLLGETKPQFSSVGSEIAPSGDRLAKVVLSLTITVRYATVGGGRPNASNAKAIKELAALLMAHELRHRDDCLAAWAKWDPARTLSVLMARTFKSMQEASSALDTELERLAGLVNAACLKLHSSEGVYTPITNPDGTISIRVTPAGASGC